MESKKYYRQIWQSMSFTNIGHSISLSLVVSYRLFVPFPLLHDSVQRLHAFVFDNCMHLWHTDSNCSHKQWPSWCWVGQAGHCMPQARTYHSWFPMRNFQYSHLADHPGQQHSISWPGGGLVVHAVPDSHLLVGESWAWGRCLFSWYMYCTGGHALP